MRVVSVNVGTPEEIPWRGRSVRTAFRKHPVDHSVAVRGVNLAGDDQADRTVHGGPRKSVYVYPVEHYAYWERELGTSRLPFGSLGENLTTEGWLESNTHLGDRVRIGTAVLVVTQPRQPCYKTNVVFGREDMIERILRSRRPGFYLGVVGEGRVGPGDPIELVEQHPDAPSIADVADGNREPS